jgi:nicotinate-nucleotide pyrophosphorylase (carboxylating)
MFDPEAESRVSQILEHAIVEDVGMGDVTTEATVDPEIVGQGEVRVKEEGIIAGLAIATLLFRIIDEEIVFAPAVPDGALMINGTVAAHLHGPLTTILRGERIALNILQRMSGIATLTRKFVDAVEGTGAKITDTRKTAPGLRMLDKLAVKTGGGHNHRFGLDDMVLIKDNHITAAGGIGPALKRCATYFADKNYHLNIEIETRSIREVEEALSLGGFQRIMLDNFSLDDMRTAVRIIDRKVEVEASGNVTLANVRAVAETGVDFVSVGALTHSVKALDLSLKILPKIS